MTDTPKSVATLRDDALAKMRSAVALRGHAAAFARDKPITDPETNQRYGKAHREMCSADDAIKALAERLDAAEEALRRAKYELIAPNAFGEIIWKPPLGVEMGECLRKRFAAERALEQCQATREMESAALARLRDALCGGDLFPAAKARLLAGETDVAQLALDLLREWAPRSAPALAKEQIDALVTWLEHGARTLRQSHKGYFAPGGWAFQTLFNLLDQHAPERAKGLREQLEALRSAGTIPDWEDR